MCGLVSLRRLKNKRLKLLFRSGSVWYQTSRIRKAETCCVQRGVRMCPNIPGKKGQQIGNSCELTASGCAIVLGCAMLFIVTSFVLLQCLCLVFQAISSSGNLMLLKFWELGVVAFCKAWTELKTSILPNGIFIL